LGGVGSSRLEQTPSFISLPIGRGREITKIYRLGHSVRGRGGQVIYSPWSGGAWWLADLLDRQVRFDSSLPEYQRKILAVELGFLLSSQGDGGR